MYENAFSIIANKKKLISFLTEVAIFVVAKVVLFVRELRRQTRPKKPVGVFGLEGTCLRLKIEILVY